jgi:3-oxoadipate enol-lactonase
VLERLAYTDEGEGQAVVLLHGLTCHLGYWLRVTPLLTGVRVVALDFRGHGLSEHRDAYGYGDYADDLVALLDALDLDEVVVAGHSLGGYVALAVATHDARIGAVVAIDVKSDWTDDDEALAERSRSGAQRVEEEHDVLLGRLARSVAPSELSGAELERMAERSLEQADGGWRLRWDRRVLATEPVEPFSFLGRVTCPVRVLAGATSAVMPPRSARAFGAAIPDATVEIVDGAGHHVELDAPQLVAARILELAQPGN